MNGIQADQKPRSKPTARNFAQISTCSRRVTQRPKPDRQKGAPLSQAATFIGGGRTSTRISPPSDRGCAMTAVDVDEHWQTGRKSAGPDYRHLSVRVAHAPKPVILLNEVFGRLRDIGVCQALAREKARRRRRSTIRDWRSFTSIGYLAKVTVVLRLAATLIPSTSATCLGTSCCLT